MREREVHKPEQIRPGSGWLSADASDVRQILAAGVKIEEGAGVGQVRIGLRKGKRLRRNPRQHHP